MVSMTPFDVATSMSFHFFLCPFAISYDNKKRRLTAVSLVKFDPDFRRKSFIVLYLVLSRFFFFFLYCYKTNGSSCYKRNMWRLSSLVLGSLISTGMQNDWLHAMWFFFFFRRFISPPLRLSSNDCATGSICIFSFSFFFLFFSTLHPVIAFL